MNARSASVAQAPVPPAPPTLASQNPPTAQLPPREPGASHATPAEYAIGCVYAYPYMGPKTELAAVLPETAVIELKDEQEWGAAEWETAAPVIHPV